MSAADVILGAIERDATRSDRYVIAVAGPPAAGKSTIADALRVALGDEAIVLGLDAFHLDDAILEARGDRARKGAPFTFDIGGYRRCLELLRSERSEDVAIPRFDRSLELSRNSAEIVAASASIVVTEGNYLLLDEPGWSGLRPLFDLTVMAEASDDLVRTRILERWRSFGLSEEEAVRRAEQNDLPNARLVQQRSAQADLVVTSE